MAVVSMFQWRRRRVAPSVLFCAVNLLIPVRDRDFKLLECRVCRRHLPSTTTLP
jgi:hypothetical protein